jgi:hypothetical protein
MCGYRELESIRRRFDEAGVERGLWEFVADAVTRVEAFVEGLKGRACESEDEEWVRGCRRRSRNEWVA